MGVNVMKLGNAWSEEVDIYSFYCVSFCLGDS